MASDSVSVAARPPCFGTPARVQACLTCGVRLACFEAHREADAVFLLPKDRPVPRTPRPEPAHADR